MIAKKYLIAMMVLLAAIVILTTKKEASAETFMSAGIGIEQIKFSKCEKNCDLLKEDNTEVVFNLRIGKYWNSVFQLPIDLGLAGTISQTGHTHVHNEGVDERVGDISLLLRYPLDKFSFYGGYGVGSIFTATKLGNCNHGGRFLTLGAEGKVKPQSATWYVEYRQFGTYHDFESHHGQHNHEESEENEENKIITRENVQSVLIGIRYTF